MVTMATRARNRIVVKSKSKTSVMSSTSSSPGGSSSDGSYGAVPMITSTPIKPQIDPGLPPPTMGGATDRHHHRFRTKSGGNKIHPVIIPDNDRYFRPPPSVGVVSYLGSVQEVDNSSTSSGEGDDIFRGNCPALLSQTTPLYHIKTNGRAQQPLYVTNGGLLPNLYVSPNKPKLGPPKPVLRHNQILPSLTLPPISNGGGKGTPTFPNSILSSPSPSLESTFSSIASSSPLPPLLIQSMRKGGNHPSSVSNWQRDTVLESVLPGGILKVYIGTWNMNELKILPTCLDDFLLPTTQETAADLFVIGTQESSPNRQEWELLLQQTIGPTHVLVQSTVLGVLYIHAFLRRDLIWYCSGVLSSSHATRPINIIKTKGGVAIRLVLFGSSFLFISSHLSGTSRWAERNSDVQKISTNLQFPLNNTSTRQNKKNSIDSHDYIFWCGDLNYRLELDKKTAEALISKSDWTSLLLKDQLTREILSENVYKGFSEQPIIFAPSYKFDVNSSKYDTSEKMRTPSWTDRVLFKSGSGGVVEGCGYGSCTTIDTSDHRPVYALFHVELQPLEEFDGVPSEPAGYNRILYARAMKRRKQVANTTLDQVNANVTRRGPATSNVHVQPTSGGTRSTNHHQSHASSSVCSIL